MTCIYRKSSEQSDSEKLQALLEGKELRSFALPTNSGFRYVYVRLNCAGDLIEGVTELNADREVISNEVLGNFVLNEAIPVFSLFHISPLSGVNEFVETELSSIDIVLGIAKELADAVTKLIQKAEELREDLKREK